MGGQKHQPTTRILTGVSAWLSQKVGDGFGNVLQANSRLEDAIIIGMDRLFIDDLPYDARGTALSYLQSSISHLGTSLECLKLIDRGFNQLFSAAEKVKYAGNPLASRLSALDLKEKFAHRLITPSFNTPVWEELSARIETSNILNTLGWEQRVFEALCAPTRELIDIISQASTVCEQSGPRTVVDMIEDNKFPLRPAYARVFSGWNHAHAMFLYSALIMTELYYLANGLPSLAEDYVGPASGAANVA